MKRTALAVAAPLGAFLLAPAGALAQDGATLGDTVSSLNTVWVVVAAVLVMFMQAGFLFLESASRARRTPASGW
jgi:Amt family ammonium transporter